MIVDDSFVYFSTLDLLRCLLATQRKQLVQLAAQPRFGWRSTSDRWVRVVGLEVRLFEAENVQREVVHSFSAGTLAVVVELEQNLAFVLPDRRRRNRLASRYWMLNLHKRKFI